MSQLQQATVRNRLLAALPPDDFALLADALRPLDLDLRQALHEPDRPIELVHFPESGMVSMVAALEDGQLMEVGLVGAVLFHALNGVRVMLIDFWGKGTRYQKQMTYVILAVFLLVMVPATYRMTAHTFAELFGSTS